MPQDPFECLCHTMKQNCNLEYLKEGYFIENEKNSISFYDISYLELFFSKLL